MQSGVILRRFRVRLVRHLEVLLVGVVLFWLRVVVRQR